MSNKMDLNQKIQGERGDIAIPKSAKLAFLSGKPDSSFFAEYIDKTEY